MSESASSSGRVPWFQSFWEDLQPTPGRLNNTLRMTLAALILLALMLVWQMPFATYALYSILVIGVESPSISLRTGVASVVITIIAIAIEMGVVSSTGNDPMARVVSVAVVTFIAGMAVVCTSLPALASIFGFIYCVVIGFWEGQGPPDRLVKNSLRLVAAFSLATLCVVAVQYVFGGRSPAAKLEEQFRIRYQALLAMFRLYAQEVSPKQRLDAGTRVSRLAAAGQVGMMALYDQIVDRNLDPGLLPIGTRVHITLLAELMDDSAAFGLQREVRDTPAFRERCARIAEQCARLIPSAIPRSEKSPEFEPQRTNSLLDRVEGTLHSILGMPVDPDAEKSKELSAVPSHKVSLLIPGAIRDRDNIAFALKISLCATMCYILYHAIDWPGTSTSVGPPRSVGLLATSFIFQGCASRLVCRAGYE